jgi:hypothetical protein
MRNSTAIPRRGRLTFCGASGLKSMDTPQCATWFRRATPSNEGGTMSSARSAPERYFVISFSEDGDVSVKGFTKKELEAKLNADYWGSNPRFLDESANFENDSGLMIIKGTLVKPGPVETVKRWGV